MAEEETFLQDGKIGEKMAPYNPTDRVAISIALSFLELHEDEIVYDLGCGDGRFLIEVSLCFHLIVFVYESPLLGLQS